MAYPQPGGMFQRPNWGGYGAQSEGGSSWASSPRASWYQGGGMSQNPAYRGPGYAHPFSNPAAAPATAPAGTPDTLTLGAPIQFPQGSLEWARSTGTPNADGLIPFGGSWTSPYALGEQPLDYTHSNPMALSPPALAPHEGTHAGKQRNPLAQALDDGSGTSNGVTMIPGFGPGNLPTGVNIDSNGGNFYQFMAANPQIPVYTMNNGIWGQTSGTPTPVNPTLMYNPAQMAAFNPIDPNAAPLTATQWAMNQNAA